jgi:hypothetical protein
MAALAATTVLARRAIPKGEVFAIFVPAPAVDADELRNPA